MSEVTVRNRRGLKFLNNTRKNAKKASSALEKLAGGYRINRSADDAAGLAVSEKLRLKLTGLDRAVENSSEGVNLIQVGESALQEVHDMLGRMAELAEQSANGTYTDTLDRESLQRELTQLCREVDRISESAVFGNIKLFQNQGIEYEYGTPDSSAALPADMSGDTPPPAAASMTLRDVVDGTRPDEVRIVYVEDPVTATTKPTGVASGAGKENDPIVGTTGKRLSQILKDQIVPQCVSNILNTYTCFSYLRGSTLGIGLNLYNDPGDSAAASVRLMPDRFKTDGTLPSDSFLGFTLSVNVGNAVNPLIETIDSADPDVVQTARADLEATIAHEMIHAFMDEATTAGMLGLNPADMSQDMSRYRFPEWFIEGMANTASGPTGWVHQYAGAGALKIGPASTDAEILNQLKTHPLNDDASVNKYGAGYLACMYLGARIGGYAGSGAVDASVISRGLSRLLGEVIGGESLNGAIKKLAGFENTAAFVNTFNDGTCPDMFEFARQLQAAREDGFGGIVSGNLAAKDVANDTNLDISLFRLDAEHQMVQNYYPADYIVGSGGSVSKTGKAPLTSSAKAPAPFTVEGGTEGTDYEYSADGLTLTIKTAAPLKVTGGHVFDAAGKAYYGRIVIDCAAGSADVTLEDVTIDATKAGGDTAGIEIKPGGDVKLTVNGISTITGSGKAAGIQVGMNTDEKTLTIDMKSGSRLNATGGTVSSYGGAGIGAAWGVNASKSNIVIRGSGTVQATGGNGAAGIGGSERGWIGDITISGSKSDLLNIQALGGQHGAGIGAGGWVSTCSDPKQQGVGDILIQGGVDITARSALHGTGIGSACHSSAGDVTIGANTEDNSKITIHTTGGADGAAIGAGWAGTVGGITIRGGTITAIGGKSGAAIGAGSGAAANNIRIEGGTITATGGTDGAAIGAGQNGTMGDITINDGTITATGGNGGAGIGTGKKAKQTDGAGITINGGTIIATGGDDGAAIGAGQEGTMGDIIINDGTITATGGESGAGIGTGNKAEQAAGAGITINGGTITATGQDASSGIGNGYLGAINSITINGGTITAKGGWTDDGGNIGGYSSADGTEYAPVTITNPGGLSIKAGADGEGKYIAIDAKDTAGEEIHAFSLAYLSTLLTKYAGGGSVPALSLSADGSEVESLSFPLPTLTVTLEDGTAYNWTNLKHMEEDGAYIWAKAQNMTLAFQDADGTTGSVALQYLPERGIWRVAGETDLPPIRPLPRPVPNPDPPVPPPVPPVPPPNPPTPPDPPVPPREEEEKLDGIILQIGENVGEILRVPRFYFSAKALHLDMADVSTQRKAQTTIGIVRKAADRVSDMRGTYGALSNRLRRNINNLTNAAIASSDSESQIRDADMAREIAEYTKANILTETSQAMLAQCNQISQDVLRLLQ